MDTLELENCSSLRSSLDNFTSTREDHNDLLARFNDRDKNVSMNFREILANEVFTSLHIDLAEDLLRVIDLYMYGKNHCFVFHERQWRKFDVLSLNHNILESLTPCSANIYSKKENGVIQMLIGQKLKGFDIFGDPDADKGAPNPLEIMTEEESIYLVPDKPANWWLNRDSKFIDLPARVGFNHLIEDARLIIRTTGPYLQLLVRRCDDRESRQSSWSSRFDWVSDDNQSVTEDSIVKDFFKCCESSQENTMVFFSPRMPSSMLEESDRTVSTRLNLSEQDNEAGDVLELASRCDPPTAWTLEESLHGGLETFNDPLTLDGPISLDDVHSREITPEWTAVNKVNDIPYLCSPNNQFKTRKSLRTNKKKTHILELGAGFLGKSERSISFRYNMTKPSMKYEVNSLDFCNSFDAIASV